LRSIFFSCSIARGAAQLDHVNGELQIRSTLSGTQEKKIAASPVRCECVLQVHPLCCGQQPPLEASPRVEPLARRRPSSSPSAEATGRAHLRCPGICRHKLKWKRFEKGESETKRISETRSSEAQSSSRLGSNANASACALMISRP
jgi:hypothetical protein